MAPVRTHSMHVLLICSLMTRPNVCYLRKDAVLTEETFDFLKDLVENVRDAPVASDQPEKKKRVRKPKLIDEEE